MHRLFLAHFLCFVALLACIPGPPLLAREATLSSAFPPRQDELPLAYQRFLASVGGSRFLQVDGVTMHYVEAGPVGRPTLVLLHGNPDNIFTWRNIMPQLVRHYHVVAPDLVGFGLSARPAIAYTWATEAHYLTDFIAAKRLRHITLVATDIGGLIGFIYATRHPQNIAGIALWETITAPIPSYAVLRAYCPSCVAFFQVPRTPPLAQSQIIENAQFAAQIYGGKGLLHPLAAAERAGYAYFLATPDARRVVAEMGAQVPVAGEPAATLPTAQAFARYLRTSAVPKLVLYGTPGGVLPAATALGLGLPNARYAAVGAGYHYLAEDEPAAIAQAILAWRVTFA